MKTTRQKENATKENRPLLTIGIIFRDNISSIERCLKALRPLRDAIPCELVMADTGSVDGSRQVAERYADTVFDFPWVNDFSAARNAIVDRARGKWYFTVDSDEYLDEDIRQLVSFLTSERPEMMVAVVQRSYDDLEMDGSYSDFMAMRLVCMSTGARYEGAIHETWTCPVKELQIYASPKTVLHHNGYVEANKNTQEGRAKLRRNLELIQKELEQNPESLRRYLQLLESGIKEPELPDWIRQAVALVKKKPSGWQTFAPPILRYGVMFAQTKGLPEFGEWAQLLQEWFPSSLFTRLDAAYFMLVQNWNDRHFDACITLGEDILKAQEEYRGGAGTLEQLTSSILTANSLYCESVRILLAVAYRHEGDPEKALALLSEVDGTALDGTNVTRLLQCAQDVHYASELDTAPLIRAVWEDISKPVPSRRKAEERMEAFAQTAAEAMALRTLDNGTAKGRRRSSLYLPLRGQCDVGAAAAILESSDLHEMEALLASIQDWSHFSIRVLAYALQSGVRFPLPDRVMGQSELDVLAKRLANVNVQWCISFLPQDMPESGPELDWSHALAEAAVNAFDWKDAGQGRALARAYAQTEEFYLPSRYSAEELEGDGMPPEHRFGWNCACAFVALDNGDIPGYIAFLRQGLLCCPQRKAMVEFLCGEVEKGQQSTTVPPELAELAGKVRTILCAYAPDDPVVQKLKQSPMYQKVAYLLEAAPGDQSGAGEPLAALDGAFFQLLDACTAMGTQQLFQNLCEGFRKLPDQIRRQQTEYFNRYPLWGTFDPDSEDFNVLWEKAKSVTEHAEDYRWLYGRLADYRSKKLLLAILRNWICYDFTMLGDCVDRCFDDYFDLDVLACGGDEVVVDLGAYIGDTALSYVQAYGPKAYRRYYCYEISSDSMIQLRRNTAHLPNMVYRQKGAGASAGTMYLQRSSDASANTLAANAESTVEVEVITLDGDINEPITFLKMDIEGAEQAALTGAERHIREDRPKLALSVYHNNEDLWKIPRMVDEFCPNYSFYLRYHGGNLWPTEITLLAHG